MKHALLDFVIFCFMFIALPFSYVEDNAVAFATMTGIGVIWLMLITIWWPNIFMQSFTSKKPNYVIIGLLMVPTIFIVQQCNIDLSTIGALICTARFIIPSTYDLCRTSPKKKSIKTKRILATAYADNRTLPGSRSAPDYQNSTKIGKISIKQDK